MRQLTTMAAAVVVLVATGCAPAAGEVTDTSHRPAWTETTHRCDTGSSGCVPQVTHYSDTYRLRLDDGQDSGWRTVTHTEYQQCPIGATFPDCTQGDAYDRAHDRR